MVLDLKFLLPRPLDHGKLYKKAFVRIKNY